jgi:hypothetical protein
MTNLGPNFYPKLVQISSELGMKPEDIIAIMASESGLKPEIPNQAGSHAIGLIQFTDGTLKNLGYNKNWREFGNVSGENQLDYVKKYIQSQMQSFNGGRPFNAATFYVATYWPVGLKLPGVRAGDPSTIITELNPPTVRGKDGHIYSKKYYDIGIPITPQYESRAYKTNRLFHGSVPGVIRLGDMASQVDRTRQGSTYRNAIAALRQAPNYQPSKIQDRHEDSKKPHSSFIGDFIAKLEALLSRFVTASERNKFLISVGSSSDYYTTMEYARILSAALEEYLEANIKICADANNIEIECDTSGDKKVLFNAIKELSGGVSDAFTYATKDIGPITTFALVTADLKSDYTLLNPKKADLCARVFKLKFARSK